MRSPVPRATAFSPTPVPTPPLVPEARAVHLLWAEAVDLDLYLTGPDAGTIYFGNPEHGFGRLRGDVGCATRVASGAQPASETVDLAAVVPGTYRVGVDFSDACTSPAVPVTFRIVVDLTGTRREATGTLVPGQFEPAALVFSVADGAVGDE